jgi:hypothetical protein
MPKKRATMNNYPNPMLLVSFLSLLLKTPLSATQF